MENNVTPIQFRNHGKRRRPGSEGGIMRMDFPLFFAVLLVCLFGLVMLFSASYYKGMSEHNGDGFYFVKNQAIYLALGILCMYLISTVPYGIYRTKLFILLSYILIIALLLMVRFFGSTVGGARRWIRILGIRFQPSEMVKFLLVIIISAYMSRAAKSMNRFFPGIVAVLGIILLPCILIFIQPNMSMLLIIVAVTFIMMIIGGSSLKQLAVISVLAAVGLFLLIKVAGYRSERLYYWLHPFEDPLDKSYQIVQSLYAFGNGGFFGRGLDASRQKLLFLPEMENDYILAIIAEELGFVGVFLLMCAYAFIIYRGIRIALTVKDRFAQLVAAGITSVLAVQILVNIGVVTNSIPATGQTLPFISAGGTSLLVFMGATGILLNISRHSDKQQTKIFTRPLFERKPRPEKKAEEPES